MKCDVFLLLSFLLNLCGTFLQAYLLKVCNCQDIKQNVGPIAPKVRQFSLRMVWRMILNRNVFFILNKINLNKNNGLAVGKIVIDAAKKAQTQKVLEEFAFFFFHAPRLLADEQNLYPTSRIHQ